MSAAKMVADSTQADIDADGRRRKRKIKKTTKKIPLPEDDDSDLDLKRSLAPISSYVKSRGHMVEEMFRAVRGTSLQRALPDLLKSIPVEELKALCVEQLEVMSKKRIRRILAGEESANISSSGTEDESSDSDTGDKDGDKQDEPEATPADSTSLHNDSPEEARNPDNPKSVPRPPLPPPKPQGFVSSFAPLPAKVTAAKVTAQAATAPVVVVKQEPQDFVEQMEEDKEVEDKAEESAAREEGKEEDREERTFKKTERRGKGYRKRGDSADSYKGRKRKSRRYRDDSSDSYSDRSRSGGYRDREKRNKKDRGSSSSSSSSRSSKSSESEDEPGNYTEGSEDGELVRKEVQPQTSDFRAVKVKQEPISDTEAGVKVTAGGDAAGDATPAPTVQLEDDGLEMVDQMELLELEMRARAIKAMLGGEGVGDEEEEDEEEEREAGAGESMEVTEESQSQEGERQEEVNVTVTLEEAGGREVVREEAQTEDQKED